MANGNPRRYSSTLEPHATISAQDLVHGQPDHCGFLRKRGKKERMLENLHLSRHINWRQRFVVIQDGCCYCFADEVSRGPLQTFSLQGYNKVYRSRSDRAAFVFRLEPAYSSQYKIHTFAATTDQDRLAWMRTFRQAMEKANEVKAPADRSTVTDVEDMYVELEKAVFQPAFPRRPAWDPQGSPEEEEEEEEEDSDDDSDYDRPDEELLEALREKQQRRNLPLPPVPQSHAGEGDVTSPSADSLSRRPMPAPPGSSGEGGAHRTKAPDPRIRPAAPLPAAAHKTTSSPSSSVSSTSSPTSPSYPDFPSARPKAPASEGSGLRSGRQPQTLPGSRPVLPQKPGRRLSERDSLFDNSDREAAIEILRECQAPGTFLIRKSRQGDSKVLVVMTSEDVKEYKIFTENHGVSLDKKTFFSTVDDLLDHYNHSPLPNRQQTLRRSYSSVSSNKH